MADNATFTLNGAGGELVRDDATGKWRPRNDDGSTIVKLDSADNGDDGRTAADKGEHWLLTTKDGTKYYFGLNKLPGGTEATNSSWTVPVFGNHSGEQCHATAFADSWCQQTYKWNLDYVVDKHGNTMSLYYDTEANYYGRNSTATAVTKYTRAGNIKRIEYGQRGGRARHRTRRAGHVRHHPALHRRTAPARRRRTTPTCRWTSAASTPTAPHRRSATTSTTRRSSR